MHNTVDPTHSIRSVRPEILAHAKAFVRFALRDFKCMSEWCIFVRVHCAREQQRAQLCFCNNQFQSRPLLEWHRNAQLYEIQEYTKGTNKTTNKKTLKECRVHSVHNAQRALQSNADTNDTECLPHNGMLPVISYTTSSSTRVPLVRFARFSWRSTFDVRGATELGRI